MGSAPLGKVGPGRCVCSVPDWLPRLVPFLQLTSFSRQEKHNVYNWPGFRKMPLWLKITAPCLWHTPAVMGGGGRRGGAWCNGTVVHTPSDERFNFPGESVTPTSHRGGLRKGEERFNSFLQSWLVVVFF